MAPGLLLAQTFFYFPKWVVWTAPISASQKLIRIGTENASPRRPGSNPGEHLHTARAGETQENRDHWFEFDGIAPTGL